MIEKQLPLCKTPTESYVYTYQEPIDFAEEQFSINWPAKEYPVEDDVHQILTEFTEAEKHGVILSTKLFTKYELIIGEDYWGGRIMKRYPRPCIQRMAMSFAHAELCMHAPFYAELNKALNLDNDEFYESYKLDKDLLDRVEFVTNHIESDNDLLSTAVFSMLEGAVLYSTFAFFKSFRANGRNKATNLVSGINASVKDENLHALAGAWLFLTEKSESNLTKEEEKYLKEKIIEAAQVIYEHECIIVDKLFEKGPISGITELQMKNFVASRVDLCLQNLGYSKLFSPKYNPIAEWFYDGINTPKLHDFFHSTGSDYNRNYTTEAFRTTW